MSTWENVEDYLLNAARSFNVAEIAGIAQVTWASTDLSIGHVFRGRGGYIRERNRGRLPFIEVFRSGDQPYIPQSRTTDGEVSGTVTTSFVMRVHVAGLSTAQAEKDLHELALEVLKALRRRNEDTYMELGEDRLTEVYNSPIGFYIDIVGSVEHSFERVTYENDND